MTLAPAASRPTRRATCSTAASASALRCRRSFATPPSYDDRSERLAERLGALEFTRTKELIGRFLTPGSRVADVGGGGGRYAEWLADEGHYVDLVEPVAVHVTEARERAGAPPRFGVHPAHARALPFPGEAFDAVLLLGPLYHLGDREERRRALIEARRVCRPGGLVFGAAISRLAPLLEALRLGALDDRTIANVIKEAETGRRVEVERRGSAFPDAHFHLPSELAGDVAAGGLDLECIFGVEGPGWLARDFDLQWRDRHARERIVAAARAVEAQPELVAVSSHLLAVCRRAT